MFKIYCFIILRLSLNVYVVIRFCSTVVYYAYIVVMLIVVPLAAQGSNSATPIVSDKMYTV